MSHIGQKIREFRKKKGLTQKELASLLGVSRLTIARWESGERKPSYAHALKLGEVLGAPAFFFMDTPIETLAEQGKNLEVPRRLKELRAKLGLSQKEFAQKTGITPTTLSLYETGKLKVPESYLYVVEKVFNVNPQWLLEGKGDMFLPKDMPKEARKVEASGLKGATLDFVAEELAEKVVAEALFERGYTSTGSVNLYSELISLAKEKIKAHYQSLKAEIGFHLGTLERFLPSPPKSSTGSEGSSPESPKPPEDEGSSGEG